MKNNRVVIVIVAVLVFAGLWFGLSSLMPEKEVGEKSLHIVISDSISGEVLYEKDVKTDAETLGEFLDERTDFTFVADDGEWGRMISTMEDVVADASNNQFWSISSDNNKDCVANGWCNGIDMQNIYDGDNFTFELTTW